MFAFAYAVNNSGRETSCGRRGAIAVAAALPLALGGTCLVPGAAPVAQEVEAREAGCSSIAGPKNWPSLVDARSSNSFDTGCKSARIWQE